MASVNIIFFHRACYGLGVDLVVLVFVFSGLSTLFSWFGLLFLCSLCSFLLLLTLLLCFESLSFPSVLLPFVHLPNCLSHLFL